MSKITQKDIFILLKEYMKKKKILMRAFVINRSGLLVLAILFGLLIFGQASHAETSGDKWVLKSTRTNPNNEQTSFVGGGALDWWYPEERYLGKTRDYLISETSFSMKDHEFDRGEYWNATFTANFTKPPSALIPGEAVSLPVYLSGSGTVTNGGGWQAGITFEYRVNGNTVPNSTQGVNLDFESVSANPSFVVPATSKEGKLIVAAFLWNCASCLVEWEYGVEEAQVEKVVETASSPVAVKEEGPESEPELAKEESPVATKKATEEEVENPCLGILSTQEIEKIESQPGGVTIIEDVRGDVEVLREGKWTAAKPYMILGPKEAVRTGPDSEAFFIIKKVLNESDEPYVPMSIQEREAREQLVRNSKAEGLEWLWGAMKAITVWGQWDFSKYEPERAFLEENSELCSGEFHETYEGERGFVSLIKGGVQMITKGWKNGSIFSVKAGTTVCGIRGSEIFVSHDPEVNKVDAYVIEGHMDVTDSRSGEVRSLTNNQKTVFENEALDEVLVLSQEEWNEIAVVKDTTAIKEEMGKNTGVETEEAEAEVRSNEGEGLAEITEATSKPNKNINIMLLLVIIIPVFSIILIFAYIKSRRK